MNTLERLYSIFAVIFAIVLLICIFSWPQLRIFKNLVSIGLLGMVINIGLMFIVLRDILSRTFDKPAQKYFWLIMVLLLWPSVLYYLPKYGFQPRSC